jgi:peptidoglycan biosynthesis protein MviN/MurJ (putative lipid II flippase)
MLFEMMFEMMFQMMFDAFGLATSYIAASRNCTFYYAINRSAGCYNPNQSWMFQLCIDGAGAYSNKQQQTASIS